jgi:hypothetical protein
MAHDGIPLVRVNRGCWDFIPQIPIKSAGFSSPETIKPDRWSMLRHLEPSLPTVDCLPSGGKEGAAVVVAPYLRRLWRPWSNQGGLPWPQVLRVWTPRTKNTTGLARVRRRWFACASDPCHAVVELAPITRASKSYPVVFALTSWSRSFQPGSIWGIGPSGGPAPATTPPCGTRRRRAWQPGEEERALAVGSELGGSDLMESTVSDRVAWIVRFDRRAGVGAHLR